jgi:hypothetical protein
MGTLGSDQQGDRRKDLKCVVRRHRRRRRPPVPIEFPHKYISHIAAF